MRHLPAVACWLTSLLLLAACRDPEADAKALHQAAVGQLQASRDAEASSHALALARLDEAASTLAKLEATGVGTQALRLLAQPLSGWGPAPLRELPRQRRPILRARADAEAGPLACARHLIQGMPEGPLKASATLLVAEAEWEASPGPSAKALLAEAVALTEAVDTGGNPRLLSREVLNDQAMHLFARMGEWKAAEDLALSPYILPQSPYHLMAHMLVLKQGARIPAFINRQALSANGMTEDSGKRAQASQGMWDLAHAHRWAKREADAERWALEAHRDGPDGEGQFPDALLPSLALGPAADGLAQRWAARKPMPHELGPELTPSLLRLAQQSGRQAELLNWVKECLRLAHLAHRRAAMELGLGEEASAPLAQSLAQGAWYLHPLGEPVLAQNHLRQAQSLVARGRSQAPNPEAGRPDLVAHAWDEAEVAVGLALIQTGAQAEGFKAIQAGLAASAAVLQEGGVEARYLTVMQNLEAWSGLGHPGAAAQWASHFPHPEQQVAALVAVNRPWVQPDPSATYGPEEAEALRQALHRLAGI